MLGQVLALVRERSLDPKRQLTDEEGLRRCQSAGYELCVLIGHADYYRRFGFTPATPLGLSNAFGVTDEHFMARELRPGAFADCAGEVIYGEAFGDL